MRLKSKSNPDQEIIDKVLKNNSYADISSRLSSFQKAVDFYKRIYGYDYYNSYDQEPFEYQESWSPGNLTQLFVYAECQRLAVKKGYTDLGDCRNKNYKLSVEIEDQANDYAAKLIDDVITEVAL
jgi:hypothetical protein